MEPLWSQELPPFVAPDLGHLHGFDFVLASPLVPSFPWTGLLLLTGKEKITYSSASW